MKKWFIVGLLFILIGCEPEVIRIGVVGSMTGSSSDLSISGRRGIELAVEEINQSGGIRGKLVELLVKDDENNPEKALQIVSEFKDEKIEIVIGPYTSGMMLSAYDRINSQEILYLGPTVSADTLSGVDDYFLRFIASTREQAVVLAQTANQNNHKKFAIIYDEKNIGFNEMLYNNFVTELENYHGSVIKDFAFNTIDEKTLQDIESCLEGVDAIFIIADATNFSYIAQHLYGNHDLGIYGPLWAHTNDLLRLSGKSIEGAYLVSGIDLDNQTVLYKTFSQNYYDRYGNNVTFSAMYSYETMKALAEAIELADSSDALVIKEKILEIGSFQGLQSRFDLDPYGDTTRDYAIDQIIKGRFVRVHVE